MKRFRSHLSTFLALSAFTLLFVCSPVSAQTTGQIIADYDDWLAATTGTLVCEDFSSVLDFDDNLAVNSLTPVDFSEVIISNSQTLAFGTLSTNSPEVRLIQADLIQADPVNSNFQTYFAFASDEDAPTPIVLDLDPDLCALEALQIGYIAAPLKISLFDGDTLVDTILTNDIQTSSTDNAIEFGWINTGNLNVTSITIEPGTFAGGEILGAALRSIKATFLPCPEPPAETCFDQLADVKAEVEALLATSTGNDAYLLQCAADCICWSQHDCFWVQPSGDRLTGYGSNVFLGSAYTISYLEWVEDPQSDVIIDQLLDTLECLVDKEIEYAIANGGRQCYIDQAVDYADLADVIDDDFDNQVVSSLAFRLAWLNAYYSTY